MYIKYCSHVFYYSHAHLLDLQVSFLIYTIKQHWPYMLWRLNKIAKVYIVHDTMSIPLVQLIIIIHLSSWNSSTLATSCEELTHWKSLWCWEGLGARGEGDNRGWDGWMTSLTRWTWVSENSGSWWWTGRPGVLQFMGSQRIGHNWATDLIWSDYTHSFYNPVYFSCLPSAKLFYKSLLDSLPFCCKGYPDVFGSKIIKE